MLEDKLSQILSACQTQIQKKLDQEEKEGNDTGDKQNPKLANNHIRAMYQKEKEQKKEARGKTLEFDDLRAALKEWGVDLDFLSQPPGTYSQLTDSSLRDSARLSSPAESEAATGKPAKRAVQGRHLNPPPPLS